MCRKDGYLQKDLSHLWEIYGQRTKFSRVTKVSQIGLDNRQTSQEKKMCSSLFLIKVQFRGPATLLKKTLTQVLPCEIFKLLEFVNFQNNYFQENLWKSASKLLLKETPKQVFSREFCELFKNTYFVQDLKTADSGTPVQRPLSNKVASLTSWTHLTVLEAEAATRGVL